jgi:hypothetical protein
MKLRFAPITFMVAFCCVYAAAFWTNKPLFLYYPLHGDFHWGPMPMKDAIGPSMAWYGLMADAGIAAIILSFLIPNHLLDRTLRNFLWVFPCGAMLVCVYLLRVFFA